MKQVIKINSISPRSLFNLSFISLTVSVVPFSFLMGVLGFFGFKTVSFAGEFLTGITALIAAPLLGFFVVISISLVFLTFGYLGLRAYGKKRQLILEVSSDDGEDENKKKQGQL